MAERSIIVTGSKGGAGTTTVALNLAVQIAQLTKKRVALLELARPFGQIALMLDVEPRFTLLDALDRGDRLDEALLVSLMMRHKTGVDILMGARHLALSSEQRQHVTLEGLMRVVQLAQGVFDFVIVDLGFVNAAEWSRVVQCADALLLVAEPSVLALAMLEGYLKAVESAGIERDRFQIVINRARQNDDRVISKYPGILRQTVFAQLANDYRQVSEAVNLGVPLTTTSNNPLVASYREMATKLVNSPKQNSAPSCDAAAVSLSHA
jgi:pilus assembly protein CpaE